MTPGEVKAFVDAPSAANVAALQKYWLKTRDASVAELLERAGRRFIELNPVKAPRVKEAFHEVWLGIAKQPSPTDVTWLADTLTSQLPTERAGAMRARDTRDQSLTARITALSKLPLDPRLASALSRALLACPFAFGREGELLTIYEAGFKQIVADGRQVEILAGLPVARAGITRALLADLTPKLIKKAQAVKSKLGAPEQKAWRALMAPGQKSEPLDDSTLLRHILEHEGDDHPRLVYADALSERGEARGEFISLQLRASPELEKRERAVLKAHQPTWLGPLHRVFTHLVFHRGFLHEAALGHNAKVEPEVWAEALEHPELRFVRRLAMGRGSATAYLQFLESPLLARLAHVDVTHSQVLARLLDEPERPLERLTFHDAPSLETMKRLRAFRTFDTLIIERLEDADALVANLKSSGLLEQLRHLDSHSGRGANRLLPLLGAGALERLSFTSSMGIITVTGSAQNAIIEGATEWLDLAHTIFQAVGHAKRVDLAVVPRGELLDSLERWLAHNADSYTFSKLEKTNWRAFHERLRLVLSTQRASSPFERRTPHGRPSQRFVSNAATRH